MLLSLALRLSCAVPLPLPVATVTCQAVPEPVTPVMLSPTSVPPSAKSAGVDAGDGLRERHVLGDR